MELKQRCVEYYTYTSKPFNRTAYGIETSKLPLR